MGQAEIAEVEPAWVDWMCPDMQDDSLSRQKNLSRNEYRPFLYKAKMGQLHRVWMYKMNCMERKERIQYYVNVKPLCEWFWLGHHKILIPFFSWYAGVNLRHKLATDSVTYSMKNTFCGIFYH